MRGIASRPELRDDALFSHLGLQVIRRVATYAAMAGFIAAILRTAMRSRSSTTRCALIVGYGPSGATDRAARIVGDNPFFKLGVPVAVDNKPGAGGRCPPSR